MKNNYCVIMAGGIGSRFWPASTTSKPKQFIDILGTGKTLLQQTFNRFKNICPPENIYIVTNKIYEDIILEQLPEIKSSQILKEPCRRNTAPCIAYACYKIDKINPEANIIVTPADHLITNEVEFVRVANIAMNEVSENDKLITLGIEPSRPDTGYGYIQYKEEEADICKVKTFMEKPDLELAQQFLDSGEFLWNAGIFVWSVKSILNSFEEHLPDIAYTFKGIQHVLNTDKEEEKIETEFPTCKNISIDYGIMEKAKNVYVIPCDFGWSDLGTWGSLYTHLNLDEHNNAIVGENVVAYDTKDCIINVPNEKLLVVQGLEDFIIVENGNTTLICKKSEEQQIKQFVNNIKIEKGDEYI